MANQAPFWVQIVPLILILWVAYFLLIKPQKDKQQQHQRMLQSLAKNDEVVTSGGIHGTVVKIDSDAVVVRVDENVRLKVEKSSIAFVKKKVETKA